MTQAPATDSLVGDAFRILVRQKHKAFLFFGITIGLVVVALLSWPRKYSSEAKLFVRVGRETVGLDPTATTGQIVGMQVTRQQEINSVLEVLRSRALAEKVVDAVSADVILASAQHHRLVDLASDQASQVEGLLGRLKTDLGDGTHDLRETAIDRIQRTLSVDASRDSPVINIRCRAQSPELAQKIVAALVNAYVHEHIRLNRTAGSEDFFETQLEVVSQRLQESTRQLSHLKSEKGIVSIEAQLKLLESQKMEIEGEQLRVARELAAARAAAQELKSSTQSLDELILARRDEGQANEAADQMRSTLYNLEIRERELSERYADDHAFVREVRRQLKDARELFEKENERRTYTSFEINPNRQQLELKMLEEQTRLAALKKTSESLTGQHAAMVNEIRQLNEDALQIEALHRRTDLLEESYKNYSENLEQARINAALEIERITNVNIVQDATLSRKPVSPNRPLVAILGLLVATTGAMGLALVAEAFDRRLKSAAEVEAVVSLPVLVTIPDSRKQCVRV